MPAPLIPIAIVISRALAIAAAKQGVKKVSQAQAKKIAAKATVRATGRRNVPSLEARKIANDAAGVKAKAPFGRARQASKPNSGRGLSKSEKEADVLSKSNKNPVTVSRTKPKKKEIVSKQQKDFERRMEIRKSIAMSKKEGKRPALPKGKVDVKIGRGAAGKKTMSQILDPLKGKKVLLGTEKVLGADGKFKDKKIYMDAQEYIIIKAQTKLAGKNPKNSVAPRTRAQEKARADEAEAKATKEARREEVIQRLRDIRDTEAAKANPRRYSSPSQETGNRIQTEGLVAQGEKRIQQELTRRAAEQAKIAKTPKRQKEVEATLRREKNREQILSETRKKSTIVRGKQKTVIRGAKVVPNRARRDK
jgi:hypothetical protein